MTKHLTKSQHYCHKCHNMSSSVTQRFVLFDKADPLGHFIVDYVSILIPDVPHIAFVVVCSVAAQLKG